jgi:hypothetical protein
VAKWGLAEAVVVELEVVVVELEVVELEVVVVGLLAVKLVEAVSPGWLPRNQ